MQILRFLRWTGQMGKYTAQNLKTLSKLLKNSSSRVSSLGREGSQ